MIVSIHVPKCAGTSFRHVLDRMYGHRIWYNYGAIFCRDQARGALVPAGTEIIHGHFLGDSFDDLYPERELLTWVRDPVERVVSNYHHFLRAPDMRDTCCQALYERQLGLRAFAELDWMRNLSSRYLAHKPIDDFQFVGISERFGESMAHFCQVYGITNQVDLPRVNTNPDRQTDRYEIAAEDRAYIQDLNTLDLAWYQQAVKRLDGMVSDQQTA